MDIFNLNLTPEENDNDKSKGKFEKLDDWFGFINNQFRQIEESHQKGKINNLLNNNDIDLIE